MRSERPVYRRWMPLAAALLTLSLITPSGVAQELRMTDNAAKQLGRVKIGVIDGRIVAQAPQLGGRISSTSDDDDRHDELTIEFTGPRPTVMYELTTPAAQLSIHLNRADKPLLRLIPRSDTSMVVPVELAQDQAGWLHLAVGAGDDRREYRAASLWYLLMDEPEVCGEHLVPLLSVLRPDWQLLDAAAEIEQEMVRQARHQKLPSRDFWGDLVARLASDEFGERREADRQLRQIGQAIVPYLESIDRARLDAEQRFRIRRIVAALAEDETEDVPHRVSQTAASDPRAWLTLLDRDDESLRTLAVDQMRQLLGEAIDYDPQASVEIRDEQIARLRKRFDLAAPTAVDMP